MCTTITNVNTIMSNIQIKKGFCFCFRQINNKRDWNTEDKLCANFT